MWLESMHKKTTIIMICSSDLSLVIADKHNIEDLTCNQKTFALVYDILLDFWEIFGPV